MILELLIITLPFILIGPFFYIWDNFELFEGYFGRKVSIYRINKHTNRIHKSTEKLRITKLHIKKRTLSERLRP